MEHWDDLDKIDFSDESIKQYHIDTRDFHCATSKEEKKDLNLQKVVLYVGRFFFTSLEVRELLDKLYAESGGKLTWRYLSIKECGENWNLKYLRIYRTEHGLVVCNKDSVILRKDHLTGKIDNSLLNKIS